jgi:hypothetical protein
MFSSRFIKFSLTKLTISFVVSIDVTEIILLMLFHMNSTGFKSGE